MKNLDLEEIADNIADEVVIAYTKDIILTPEEAYQLNQLVFHKALGALTAWSVKDKPLWKQVTQ